MSSQKAIKQILADLRGGRNGGDPPLSLPPDQCVEALNVDWYQGTLANKRGGASALSVTFSSGGPFVGGVSALWRHVPGADETAAELWAVDSNAVVGRLVASTLWVAPTLVDAVSFGQDVRAASFAGFGFQAYNSAQNRLHCWDSSISKVRRVGLATPDPPSVATAGGSGLSFTRYYRIRTVDVSGSDVRRRSEASTVVSITISDDQGVTVTRPTLPTNENETHWETEYADASTGPWYRAGRTATGTSTYSDTDATVDTTDLSDSDGIHWPPPSAKFLVKDSARLVMGGCWETSGGYTDPSNTRVWWTPPIGALDVGDSERIPTGYYLDVEEAITGMGGPVDGSIFVFGYRSIWQLVPTGLPGANAYQRFTLSTSIGCIRQETIVAAEDENGQPALYFLSHRGPYRLGSGGLQYLGNDIEDLWETVNLAAANVAAHGVHHADKHQVWWWIATASADDPNAKVIYDTRLGRSEGESVTRGWAKHDGNSAVARCSVIFSTTVGATMSRNLKPYIGQAGAVNRIWKCDTGTDDAGTDFQAYVETRPETPAGLGTNVSVTDPILVAEAASGVTITVTPISDFGLASTQAGTALLTAAGSETRVIKRVEGLQASGVGTIAYRIGDAAAADNAWTLDALQVTAHPQESRS